MWGKVKVGAGKEQVGVWFVHKFLKSPGHTKTGKWAQILRRQARGRIFGVENRIMGSKRKVSGVTTKRGGGSFLRARTTGKRSRGAYKISMKRRRKITPRVVVQIDIAQTKGKGLLKRRGKTIRSWGL